MKRKTMMVVTLITAISMLAFLAFAGTNLENGYELFKDVIKNQETHEAVNAFTGELTVTDNGVTLISLEGKAHVDEASQSGSGTLTLTVEDYVKTLEFYGLDKMIYIIDRDQGDVYVGEDQEEAHYDKKSRFNDHRDFESHPEFDEKAEAILDILIGDLKHEFEIVEDTDGTTDVKFELTKSEMPALFNMMASMDHEEDAFCEEDASYDDEAWMGFPLFDELQGLELEHDELENIELEQFSITLDLDANRQIEGLKFEVKLTGRDEDGLNHVVEIKGAVKMLEENVVVEMPSLDGMTVYELPQE